MDYVNTMAVAVGLYQTFDGATTVGQGNIKKGADKASAGYVVLKLASLAQGMSSETEFGLIKNCVCIGIADAAWQGLVALKDGVRDGDVLQAVKAIAQTALATAGVVCILPLEASTGLAGQHALNAMVMVHVAYSGRKTLANISEDRLCKSLFAIFLSYVIYQQLTGSDPFTNEPLTAEENAFLATHTDEIEAMYRSGWSTGEWSELGQGVDKRAYTHPDLPSKLVKIPKNQISYWGENNAALRHHQSLEAIRSKAKRSDFPHILIPSSHVMQSKSGPYLVEQKFSVVFSYRGQQALNVNPQVVKEYNKFISQYALCDISVQSAHNAGVIQGTENTTPTIGVFDFDCKDSWLSSAETVKYLVIMYLVAFVASGITKKMAGAKTADICKKLAIGTTVALLTLNTATEPQTRLLLAELAGASMIVATTVGVCAFKSLRCLARQLMRCCGPKAQPKPLPATLELLPT